jgi:hypothetical protein
MMSYALTLVEEFQAIKSLARIAEGLARVAKDWAEKLLSDDEYQMLAAFLHLKQKAVREGDTVSGRMPSLAAASKAAGFTSFFPPKRPYRGSPDREASQARRKMLCALRPLPSLLARRFTTGQQAVLKIVADEVRRKGFCALYLSEIAARAGVCLTHARNAIREAAYMGLITIQERKQHKRPNLSNIVRIISAEWLFSRNFFLFDFLKSTFGKEDHRGGASRKVVATDEVYKKPDGKAAAQPYSDLKQPSG